MSSENRIGIIGGGQLGRMMVPDAKRLGYEVTVLEAAPNCPAAQMGAEQIVGSITDEAKIRELAARSDFLTWEIEHTNAEVLVDLASEGVRVSPSPETLLMIKDKFGQKDFLRNAGIPVVNAATVRDRQDIVDVAVDYSYPIILKSRFDAFDGRRNVKINTQDEIEAAMSKLDGSSLYVEQMYPFEKELAIMIARGTSGEIAKYPVVETIHEDNICHVVLAPAPIAGEDSDRAEEVASRTMELLHGAGIYGIEMFLGEGGEILVNEIAPRVHNSGHYTLDANETSQFEQLVRAITGLPLGSTRMIVEAAAMVNILGEREPEDADFSLDRALEDTNAKIYLYGKTARKGRKLGHINTTATSVYRAKKEALRARSNISV